MVRRWEAGNMSAASNVIVNLRSRPLGIGRERGNNWNRIVDCLNPTIMMGRNEADGTAGQSLDAVPGAC